VAVISPGWFNPHVRDYHNQEYKAELCYKAPLCTPIEGVLSLLVKAQIFG